MNYLSGALRYVAGTDQGTGGVAGSGVNVARLIDRIKTSALPHDRRSAIAQLNAAAKTSTAQQSAAGELGLKVIYAVLDQDTDFDDTVQVTLELLITLCSALDAVATATAHPDVSIAATNTDVFLGLPNALPLLLPLLARPDFHIRFSTVELLAAMAAASRYTLQAAILEAPQGAVHICDALDDAHKLIRSNVVALLASLCSDSPDICQIVVFASVLDKLFALIESATAINTSPTNPLNDDDDDDNDDVENIIIVQDALITLRNLARGSPSTKVVFKDTACAPRLASAMRSALRDAALPLAHRIPGTDLSPSDAHDDESLSGLRASVRSQARTAVRAALQAVSALSVGSDGLRPELTAADIPPIVTAVALSSSGPHDVRVAALRALTDLSATTPPHIDPLLQHVRSDASAAVRAAAFCVVRAANMIPSTSLLLDNPDADAPALVYVAQLEPLPPQPQAITRVLARLAKDAAPPAPRAALLALLASALHADPSSARSLPSATPPLLADALQPAQHALVRGAAAAALALAAPHMRAAEELARGAVGPAWLAACLDDIAALSPAPPDMWAVAEEIATREPPLLAAAGQLGHDLWFAPGFAAIATEVRDAFAKRVPLLVPPIKQPTPPALQNGHAHDNDDDAHLRAEIENYKQCIRDQDEHAKTLEAKLKLAVTHERFAEIERDRDDLAQQKADLNLLLEEKESECNEALQTLSILETQQQQQQLEQATPVTSSIVNREREQDDDSQLRIEMRALKAQNENLSTALDVEMKNSMDRTRRISLLEDTINRRDIEIETLSRDVQQGSDSDMSAAQWKDKAEIAESLSRAHEDSIATLQDAQADLETRLIAAERLNEGAAAQIDTHKQVAQTYKAELAKLKTAPAVDQNQNQNHAEEVDILKAQLLEAQEKINEQSKQLSVTVTTPAPAPASASDDWKLKYDEKEEEATKLTERCAELEATVDSLSTTVDKEQDHASASDTRVAELHQELQEARLELDEREKELHRRTEDYIQASGKAYDLEERTAELEEQLRQAQSSNIASVFEDGDDGQLASLRDELAAAKAELEQAKRNPVHIPTLTHASTADTTETERETKEALVTAQAELAATRDRAEDLVRQLDDMSARLLSSDEAEHAKKALTMQVVELQRQLDEYEDVGTQTNRDMNSASRAESNQALESVSLDLQAALRDAENLRGDLDAARAESARFAEDAARLPVLEAELQGLRDNLANAEAQLNDKEEVDAMSRTLSEQQEQLSAQARELEHMEQRFATVRSAAVERDALEQKCASLEEDAADIDMLRGEVALLQVAVDRRAAECEELETALQNSTQENAHLSAAADEKAAQIEALRAKADEATKAGENLVNTVDNLEQRCSELEAAVSNKTDQIDTLRQQAVALEQSRDKAQSEAEAASDRHMRELDNVDILEQKCSELEAMVSGKSDEVDTLKQQVNALEEGRDNARNDAEAQNEQQLREVESAVEEKSMEILALKENIKELERATDETNEKAASYQDRCKQYESTIESKSMELELLQSSLTESKRLHEDQSTRLRELEQEHQALTARHQDVQQAVQEKDIEIEAVKASHAGSQQTHDSLEASLRIKDDELLELHAEMSELQKEKDDLSSKLTDMTVASEMTEIECKASVEANVQKVRTLQAEVKELNKKCSQLGKELAASKTEATLKVDKWRGVTETQVQVIAELRNQVESAELKVTSVEEDMAELSEKVTNKDKEIGDLNDLVEARRIELEESDRATESLTSELAHARLKLQVLDNLVTQLKADVNNSKSSVQSATDKLVALTSSLEVAEAGKRTLETQLADAEQRANDLSSEFAVVRDVCKAAEEEAARMREQNQMIRGDMAIAEENLRSVTCDRDDEAITKDVENVVESIVLNASLLATVDNLSATRSALCRADDSLIELRLDMEVLRSDRDEARRLCATQEQRLSQLFAQLAGMQLIAAERDQLRRSLDSAEKRVRHAEQQRDAALSARSSEPPPAPNGEMDSNRSTATAGAAHDHIQRRVTELEGALRDAARTVAATNKELISAQALLVEISSDKTAMRAALASAEKQIRDLVASNGHTTEVTDTTVCNGEAVTAQKALHVGTLSEVSDTDADENRVLETQLKAARIEVANLQTALSRSVAEAKTASSLVADITAKIDATQMLVDTVRTKENSLLEKLSAAEAHRVRLEHELAASKQDYDDMKNRNAAQLDSVSKKAADERTALEAQLSQLDVSIAELNSERDDLSSQVEDLSTQLSVSKEKLGSAERASVLLQDERSQMESRWHEAQSELSSSEQLVANLQSSVARMKEQDAEHERDALERQKKYETEASAYELEIERVSSEVEVLERNMRTKDSEFRTERVRMINEKNDLKRQLQQSDDSVEKLTASTNKFSNQVAELQAQMARVEKEHATELQKAALTEESLRADLTEMENNRNRLELDVENVKLELSKLKEELGEEREKRTLLEEENQEFETNIEWLEQRCKNVEEEVKTLKLSNERVERLKSSVERRLEAETANTKSLRQQLEENSSSLKEVTKERDATVGDLQDMKVKLEEKCADYDQLEKDNAGLREWVTDLERQANELQAAGSDFEEVEKSLQESLEAHRKSVEHVNELQEDLKQERSVHRQTEVRMKKAEREKETVDISKQGVQEQLQAVEKRLRDSREAHVKELRNAEHNVHQQVQRCNELETQLVEAQRQVAELNQYSDEVFSMQSTLVNTREELNRTRERCDQAEVKLEQVELDLSRANEEVDRLNGATGGDGMKALEAEHNELLIYLADLELELTNYKDAADVVDMDS